MLEKIMKRKKALTEAMLERGLRQLTRLEVLLDVIFGLMIFQIFLVLPRPELDDFGSLPLQEALANFALNYAAAGVGIILVILYWNMNNLQFGNLIRTDSRHTALSIIQVFCLMIYLYFLRLDIEFDGAMFALQMESLFLALAGFVAVLSWHYSKINNLISDSVTGNEKKLMYLSLSPEPITSALTFPFAWLGPDIWSLSWLLLFPVSWIIKRIIKVEKEDAVPVEEASDPQ